jgi:hypothetical protein
VVHIDLEKFNFRIRTRSGVVVDRVTFSGQSEEDALRRLRQAYPECQLLETWNEQPATRQRDSSLEDVIDLITR